MQRCPALFILPDALVAVKMHTGTAAATGVDMMRLLIVVNFPVSTCVIVCQPKIFFWKQH